MCTSTKLKKENYELLPPDGGYGYVIASNFIIVLSLAWISLQTFGITYGQFLANFGNEAQHISTICSTYFTVEQLAGLPSNVLLQKLSYRKVAFLGALFYITGTISSVFVTSITQLIFTYSVLQGIGMGILYCCSCTIFNEYFHLRRSFVMNCLKVVVTIALTISPTLTMLSMYEYGFKGTLAIAAAASLHLLFVALCFQPVKWHAKKKHLNVIKLTDIESKTTALSKIVEVENESLLDDIETDKTNANDVQLKFNYSNSQENDKLGKSKPCNICRTIYNTLDLGLFMDPKYINIAFGVGLGMAGDILFASFLPLLLQNSGFYGNDVALLMTIHAIFDFVGKIALCVLTGFMNIKNRYLQIIYALITATFRFGFVISNSFGWIALVAAVLGFVRCLIQNTLPLVFAEIYPKRFVTALTLFMVCNSLVVSCLGQVIRFATTLTTNKNVILYILGTAPAFFSITWITELLFTRLRKN